MVDSDNMLNLNDRRHPIENMSEQGISVDTVHKIMHDDLTLFRGQLSLGFTKTIQCLILQQEHWKLSVSSHISLQSRSGLL